MKRGQAGVNAAIAAVDRLLEHALADVRAGDEFEHQRIRQELERGGFLRLAVDPKFGVRVRLVVAPGGTERNRWVWQLRGANGKQSG